MQYSTLCAIICSLCNKQRLAFHSSPFNNETASCTPYSRRLTSRATLTCNYHHVQVFPRFLCRASAPPRRSDAIKLGSQTRRAILYRYPGPLSRRRGWDPPSRASWEPKRKMPSASRHRWVFRIIMTTHPHSLPHRYYHDCTDLLVDYCVVPHHYPGAAWRLRSLLDYVFNGFSYITDHILGRRISFLEVNAG